MQVPNTPQEDLTPKERRDYTSISKDIKHFVHDELAAHEEREKKCIKGILDAFPDQDVEGHRVYHDNKIKAAKAEEECCRAAKSEVLKHGIAGIMAVLKWVLILAALGLAYKFGFGPAVAKVLGIGV